jgi:hypothetical protein
MLVGWKHRAAGLRNHVPPPRYGAFCTEPTSPQAVTAIERERLYLYGIPPNLAHADDTYQSLLPYAAGENAKALHRSLYHDDLDTTATITAGHGHTEAAHHAGLSWIQAASWRTPTTSSIATNRPGVEVSSTSFLDYAFVGFVLPSGLRYVVPRVRFSGASSSVYLTVWLRWYDPADVNTEVADGELSCNTATAGLDGWVEGGRVDLSGVATTNSRRLVYLRVSAKVNTSTADLCEVQCGLSWGG